MKKFISIPICIGLILAGPSGHCQTPARYQPRSSTVTGASAWIALSANTSLDGSSYVANLYRELSARGALENFSRVMARTANLVRLDPEYLIGMDPESQESLIRKPIWAYAQSTLKTAADQNLPAHRLIILSQQLEELQAIRSDFPEEVPAEIEAALPRVQQNIHEKLLNYARALQDPERTSESMAKFAADELFDMSEHTELPEFALTALAESLNSSNRYVSDMATEALDLHAALPPATLGAMEKLLDNGMDHARARAAEFLLLHNPEHPKAALVLEDHIKSLPAAKDWNIDLESRSRHAGSHRYFRVMPEDILAFARQEFGKINKNDPDGSIKASFDSFLERAAQYAKHPRRLVKVLENTFSRYIMPQPITREYWDARLPNPYGELNRDRDYKKTVLGELRGALPEILGKSNDIAGVFVVGSLGPGQPAPGSSDLDLVIVTKIPGRHDRSQLASLITAPRFGLKRVDIVDDALLGSLKYQRYQSLGAVYIPAAQRSNREVAHEIHQLLAHSDLPLAKLFQDSIYMAEYASAHLLELFLSRSQEHQMTLREYFQFLKEQLSLPLQETMKVTFKALNVDFLNDWIFFMKAFASSGQVSRWANYDLDTREFAIRPFYRQLKQIISGSFGKRRELVFRIVGLGDSAQEFLAMSEILDRILAEPDIIPDSYQRSFEGMDPQARAASVAKYLGIQIRLYDKSAQALSAADKVVASEQRHIPWLKDRVSVNFADMTASEQFKHWRSETTVLVMARNSLRKDIMRLGRDFMAEAARSLVESGMFVTDPDAAFWLGGKDGNRDLYVLEDPISFNGHSDRETFMFLKNSGRRMQ